MSPLDVIEVPGGFRRGHDPRRSSGLRHGGRYTAEYRAWSGMIRRCESPRCPKYPRYGGRGISVCQRWRSDFAAFVRDVGPRPSPQHSIDRINGNGNYEPGNVRWATVKQQQRNRSSNKRLTINGLTLTVSEWAEQTGVRANTIVVRLRRGWSPERAVAP